MNAFYNISAALVAQRDQTKAMAVAARAAWQTAQDADEENVVLAEMWENYEEIRAFDHEALWALQQTWVEAAHHQPVPVDPEIGHDMEYYEDRARIYRIRAELDHAIVDAYIELGYQEHAWTPFWEERKRMDTAAELCESYVNARREHAAAEAERERLLGEWAMLPAADKKSSHPLFRARVAAVERASAARELWFLSPLYVHELPVEARHLWLALEPARRYAAAGLA